MALNPIDYRIRRNKEMYYGVVSKVLKGPYANIHLSDGRTVRFVHVPGTPAAGQRVRIWLEDGLWRAEAA